MNLEGILSYTRSVIQKVVRPGDITVDGTVGNGHDTLFLAQLVGSHGHVYGFDIQESAIINTKKALEEKELQERVTLFQIGHETIGESLPSDTHGRISGAMFNLGYLPGGDKSVVTKPETTIKAVTHLIDMLSKGGIIALVIYPGHEEGVKERDELLEFASGLDQKIVNVLQYSFINQRNNPPFLLAFEKK